MITGAKLLRWLWPRHSFSIDFARDKLAFFSSIKKQTKKHTKKPKLLISRNDAFAILPMLL